MVVKRRLLLAIAAAVSATLVATTPMVAATYAEAQPKPLRQDSLLRVKDMAANGSTPVGGGTVPVVAVGWRQGSSPGQLFLAFSTDGGKDYRRNNGRLRKYKILGDGRLGMSVDVCAGRVWAASAFRNAGDQAGDSDVIVTTRTIGGGADQRLLTSSSASRKVRDVQIACIGDDLVAVAWLERSGGEIKARLLIRSTEALSQTPSYQRVVKLEDKARYGDGIALAATKDAIHVSWSRGNNQNLRLARVPLVSGVPDLGSRTVNTIAFKDARFPVLAAHGQNVVIGYSDAGKVRAKLSDDAGASWGQGIQLIGAGAVNRPSKAYSVDIHGQRIVLEGSANKKKGAVAKRVQSTDLGSNWSSRDFGHKGARVGALLKKQGKAPLLRESWHNNASTDTLRAQFQRG